MKKIQILMLFIFCSIGFNSMAVEYSQMDSDQIEELREKLQTTNKAFKDEEEKTKRLKEKLAELDKKLKKLVEQNSERDESLQKLQAQVNADN
jgi:peptidoglycan hydrolase CwlO-like protein